MASAAASELTAAAAKLSKASAEILGEIERRRATIVELRAKVKSAQRSSVPRTEAKGRIPDLVREEAARWTEKHAGSLLRHPGEFHGHSLALGSAAGRGKVRLPTGLDDAGLFGAICAAQPALAESLLVGLIDAVPDWQEGTASTERGAELAKLQTDLEAAEREEEALVDQCIATGLDLAHRPEVASRRVQAEARRRDRENARREAEERQARINARLATRTNA